MSRILTRVVQSWDAVGLGLLMCAAVALLCVTCVTLWKYLWSPVFELEKSEWTCTRIEPKDALQPMIVGKATLLLPKQGSVCTQYTRNASE
jgi:hypothetical protein